MATAQENSKEASLGAIFARVWQEGLSPGLARHVLKLNFSKSDKERMRELAEKNREASLDNAEEQELDNYVQVGDFLAILQSRTRKLLKKTPPKVRRHG